MKQRSRILYVWKLFHCFYFVFFTPHTWVVHMRTSYRKEEYPLNIHTRTYPHVHRMHTRFVCFPWNLLADSIAKGSKQGQVSKRRLAKWEKEKESERANEDSKPRFLVLILYIMDIWEDYSIEWWWSWYTKQLTVKGSVNN